jgi:hypothetical protein
MAVGARVLHSIRALGQAVVCSLVLAGSTGCGVLPNEFNAIPLYRQRVAADGTVLEVDFLWPIYHYERTPYGGHDHRIRPLWRRISPEPEHPDRTRRQIVEHQFLWPFGRSFDDPYRDEWFTRLFPFWWMQSKESAVDGVRDVDWYAIFPFFWGGYRADGDETYFGVFPFYADFPQFLTYERFYAILFPLYFHTEKQGRTSHQFLWPFTGFGYGPGGEAWYRLLPLFYWRDRPGFFWRFSLLYPFLTWSKENLDTEDPVSRFFFFPLYGRILSESGRSRGWTVLWPFFSSFRIGERVVKWTALWPVFRRHVDRSPDSPLDQWAAFPFVTKTTTTDQWSWSILWPLVWLRRFADPEGVMTQHYFLPFFWNAKRKLADGSGEERYWHLWPLARYEADPVASAPGTRKWDETVDPQPDGSGEFRMLALWPNRRGRGYGMREAYGWAWTLWVSQRRAPDDDAAHAFAHLYTQRERKGAFQCSVPFLFNYERTPGEGRVLRLFQVLPIWWSDDPGTKAPQADGTKVAATPGADPVDADVGAASSSPPFATTSSPTESPSAPAPSDPVDERR